MGKRIKFREAELRARDRAVQTVLAAHSRRERRRHAPERCDDFDDTRQAAIAHFRASAIHAPATWRCRVRTRSADARFLDLVRFAFAKYPVARHLENAWVEDCTDDFVDRPWPLETQRSACSDRPDLRAWHIVAAQGGSLYKTCAHAYLSKTETHHFLTAPATVTSTRRAFWYARARAQGADRSVAISISQTALDRFSVASSYWKEVVRFFAHNPVSVHEMNDLIDYLAAAKEQELTFSLKGRTLATLRRRMDAWHRMLRTSRSLTGGFWRGASLPDIDYQAGSEDRKGIWRFRQIRTGDELYKEGQRMHHCVATYKFDCLLGKTSIWSLTSEYPLGQVNRGITIELRKDGQIVQCRGFANRRPYANEAAVVKRWAADNNLTFGYAAC